MTIQEFALKIKTKYPQYNNLDDNELAQKILLKYPQYRKHISVESIPQRSKTEKVLESKPVKFFEKAGQFISKGGEALLNPTVRAIQTGIMQPIREVQRAIPGGKTGEEEYKTPFGTIKDVKKQGKLASGIQAAEVATAGLPVERLVMTPLTKAATKLYQSGMKARNIVKGGKVIKEGKEIAQIGVDERIWLTGGGVERVAQKIDKFEDMLGQAIEKAKGAGKKIDTTILREYVKEAKQFFANQVDVEDSTKAIAKIDDMVEGFIKKYGKEVPIEKAQQIKVNTGQLLRRYYDRLANYKIEGTKQIVRGLKEEIVEKAPIVGDINKRLSNLYTFDQALSKASTRIGNLNLLGLVAKGGGVIQGPKGLVIGKLLELVDAPALKSGVAINLDRLATGGNKVLKGVKVPLASLIDTIIEELRK